MCCVLSRSVMSDSATPWTIAHQAPLSMGPGKNTGVGCHSLLQFLSILKLLYIMDINLVIHKHIRYLSKLILYALTLLDIVLLCIQAIYFTGFLLLDNNFSVPYVTFSIT